VSAEAIARLRLEAAGDDDDFTNSGTSIVRRADLRALLDAHAALEAAHTEALDALRKLRDNAEGHNLRGLSHRTALQESIDVAEAVLAKAGRR
jgi:hypothetical protein